MGTNYYVERDPCPCCGRGGVPLHIGKSSMGWAFALRVYPELGIDSFADWLVCLADRQITDEYGGEVSFGDMVRIIACRTKYFPLRRASDDPHSSAKRGEGTWDYHEGNFS